MKFGVILEILQKHEKHENYFDVTENLCYKVHIQSIAQVSKIEQDSFPSKPFQQNDT